MIDGVLIWVLAIIMLIYLAGRGVGMLTTVFLVR